MYSSKHSKKPFRIGRTPRKIRMSKNPNVRSTRLRRGETNPEPDDDQTSNTEQFEIITDEANAQGTSRQAQEEDLRNADPEVNIVVTPPGGENTGNPDPSAHEATGTDNVTHLGVEGNVRNASDS